MLAEALIAAAVLLFFWYQNTKLPANHPPTPPIRLPILGHFHYFLFYQGTKTTSPLCELYKSYNKNGVLSLFVGSTKITLVGTYQLARDLFTKEETNRRLYNEAMQEHFKRPRQVTTGTEGLVFNHGKNWQEQRRFMLATLRDFGFGKSDMEGMINEEVKYFMDFAEARLQKVNSKEVSNVFNIPILNILWQIVAGDRFKYDDPGMKELIDAVTLATSVEFSRPDIVTFLPWLRNTPLDPGPNKDLAGLLMTKKFLQKEIDKHRKTFDPDNIRDFIDAYLLEIKTKGNPGSSFHEPYGYEQLVCVLIDLFVAGSETTSNTLSFAFLFMIRHPDVQEKVRQEIWDVIGQENAPQLSDRARMPYTDATIMEIQRMADVAPEGVFHMNVSPVQAGPYVIPPGNMIMPSLTSVMKNPDQWKDGETFDPTRFLDAKGKAFKDEKLIPFSTGKRQCPGESLAKAELFLFFVGLMQKFKFEAKDGNVPDLEMVGGVTNAPKPYNVKLSRAC